jgi:hypothetical protein
VGVVGWRFTWPVEAVNGFMVSDRLHRRNPKDYVYPQDLAPYVKEVIGGLSPIELGRFLPCEPGTLMGDPRAKSRVNLLESFLENDLRYQAVAESLFSALDPTFMALGLTSIDANEHLFYYEYSLHHEPDKYSMSSYLERFTSSRLVECLGGVIDSTYVLHDRLLQRWIDWLGEDGALIIVSDHGHVMDGNAHHYPEPGVLMMYGGPFRRGYEIEGASVYDIAPTVLYLLGLPVPEDIPGRVLKEAFRRRYLDYNPMAMVRSYETQVLEEQEEPPEADEELLDRLKALGYIN